VLMSLLALRLYWLQTRAAAHYHDKVRDAFALRPQWLDTLRGSIYDRHQQLLAVDEAKDNLCFHYRWSCLFDRRAEIRLIEKYLEKNKAKDPTRREADINLRKRKAEAEKLLIEVARLCEVDVATLRDGIDDINNLVFNLQMARARRLLCQDYGLKWVPKPNIKEIRTDYESLLKQTPEAEEDPNRLIAEVLVGEMNQFLSVMTGISRNTALVISERYVESDPTVSVRVVTEKSRRYDYGSVACHLLGQVGPVPQSQVVKRPTGGSPSDADMASYFEGDRKGSWGIERTFEHRLRGRRGWRQKNKKGEFVHPPLARELGEDITLTIDIALQEEVESIFTHHGYRGAAMIIDIVTGEILAAVSAPTYDLNTYFEQENWERINEAGIPWAEQVGYGRNRAISENYQPGSTLKTAILLGALEEEVVRDTTLFHCSEDNKDWEGPPSEIRNDGSIDAYKAICVSCNFYFIKIAICLGGRHTGDFLEKCGWSRRILAWPDELTAEQAVFGMRETAGHLPAWSKNETRFAGIGRGAVDGSILHIANHTATIARKGVYLAPRLVLSPEVPSEPVRIGSADNASIVLKGMRDVIYAPDGTAFDAYLHSLWPEEVVQLYGKTGSTNHSLFTCIAKSADGQRLALALVVDYDGDDPSGGDIAAPLALEILQACAEQEYLPPLSALD